MNQSGHGSAGPEDELLGRWYAVSAQSTPAPSAQLLASREPKHRRRPALRNLMVAAVTVAAVIAGVVGGAVWVSFRRDDASSGAPTPSASISPTASRRETPTPTIDNASGPELAEHEHVIQMRRTSTGGWLLTRSRLRMLDGTRWRDCWSNADQGSMASPQAIVMGSTIRILSGTTLWTSTDDCASWAATIVPAAGVPTGLAFVSGNVGYAAYTDYEGTIPYGIYRTVDGGAHWATLPLPVTIRLSGDLGVAFADAEHGWVTEGQTLQTSNVLLRWTWYKATLPVPASVRGRLDTVATPVIGPDGAAATVVKYDSAPGMDGAPGQQVFYRTTDLGEHWTAAAVVSDPGTLEISMIDATTWVVFDPSTASFRATADGGATWRTVGVREKWPYSRGPITFADSLHGWMLVSEPNQTCAAGVQCDYLYGPPEHLAATDDGGMTWVELKP
jgi:photosystem II stability/assembly factor-like uncharacterized protein